MEESDTESSENILAPLGTTEADYGAMDDIGNNPELFEIQLIRSPLLLSMIISACFNVCLSLFYWCFLLYHTSRPPTSRPPLFLNFLLLAICLSSFTSIAPLWILLPPHLLLHLRAISYSLTYSSLLSRTIQIRAIHKSYSLLPFYQYLLLFFCFIVQISLVCQLLLVPDIQINLHHPLLSFAYPAFLFLTVGLFSTPIRSSREMRHEGRSIWYTFLFSFLIWVSWMQLLIL